MNCIISQATKKASNSGTNNALRKKAFKVTLVIHTLEDMDNNVYSLLKKLAMSEKKFTRILHSTVHYTGQIKTLNYFCDKYLKS